MKHIIVACALAGFITQVFSRDHYSTKYDNLDVDDVIGNQRFYNSIIKCFLDKGRCTPDGARIKGMIPEALETSCANCSEKQKDLVRKFVKSMRQRKPEDWSELSKKFDPLEKFTESFDIFLAS